MKTYGYGFPRIGANREYKKVVEGLWKADFSKEAEDEMTYRLGELQDEIIETYEDRVDEFPVNEMTRYDWMLDTAIMVGRYTPTSQQEYFDLCRGKNALEMTKWFNTNYHYLVPTFDSTEPEDLFLNGNPLKEAEEARDGVPWIIGPFTFLRLSKGVDPDMFREYLASLSDVYRQALSEVSACHIHEPAFAGDVSAEDIAMIQMAYTVMAKSKVQISLFCYYDDVDFLPELFDLPVAAIGLDFLHGGDNLDAVSRIGFPKDKELIAGLVDGRNVWRTEIDQAVLQLQQLALYAPRLSLSNAAPLFHLPVSLEGEELEEELMDRLAFATEKLDDVAIIKAVFEGTLQYEPNQPSSLGENAQIRKLVANLDDDDFLREASFEERRPLQQERFKLPLFPTTTIGSFPQTKEVRKARADYRKGRSSSEEYREFIRTTIKDNVHTQEEVGLDVLVHGEPERSDMVEFFAERLDGIATTDNGWIISYGTRGYRPPIIYGDVLRPEPMTVEEISYAQSLTDKPVKGMLTGPVTIIAWSFVREDVPRENVAYQIALALQEEVSDYEDADIGMIQIDEPAFRELAPNKRSAWDDYFAWATGAFRLATAKALPETQIHTHMCYSEFNEIISYIQQMDFDVISIEATRSKGEVIGSFEEADFDRQIGIGVYDIHSPAVPEESEIGEVIRRSTQVIPKENFWINPDCGLKTRAWEETIPALSNMVNQAKAFRQKG
jgi:5-methyltetrahydropteroyltriglutamate--homocysteine methyltransferase